MKNLKTFTDYVNESNDQIFENDVKGKFEIRGEDINNDGDLFYSLYLNGKQIGPNVIKSGGVTSGKDFEETLRKFIK